MPATFTHQLTATWLTPTPFPRRPPPTPPRPLPLTCAPEYSHVTDATLLIAAGARVDSPLKPWADNEMTSIAYTLIFIF